MKTRARTEGSIAMSDTFAQQQVVSLDAIGSKLRESCKDSVKWSRGPAGGSAARQAGDANSQFGSESDNVEGDN
jgi:hypothetical protein